MWLPSPRQGDNAKNKSPAILFDSPKQREVQHLPCLTQHDTKSALYKEEVPEEEDIEFYL